MNRFITALIILIISTSSIVISVSPLAVGQQNTSTDKWVSTGFDYNHTGFNPQTVINKDNVKYLELKWIYQLPMNPYRDMLQPSLGLETNPLLVNGILYVSASYGRLFAINSLTGNLVWSHEVNITEAIQKPYIGNFGIQHSILYRDGLIYQLTIDCTLYGFDAITGSVKTKITDICKDIPGNKGQYFGEEAPSIYVKGEKRIAILSVAAGLFYARGFAAAYDLNTGKLLWRWFSTPPQEEGPKVDWDKDAGNGNIKAYDGDWGTTGEAFGGSIWVTSSIDQEKGVVFLGTGYPGVGLTLAGHMDASLIPGPNLYTNSLVALDIETGQMKWYYQTTPHDVLQHGFGWNIVMAETTIDGVKKKVIVSSNKNGYLYEIDAETGKPVVAPIKLGVHFNDLNSNLGNEANMKSNQKEETTCPGGNGGVESPVAFASDTIFVASQNRCFNWRPVDNAYNGQRVWVAGVAIERPQNSTLYAIDAPTGRIKWQFNMANPYQGAGIIVSGGIVFAIDRIGTLYMINEVNGELIRSIYFGGLGAAGVTIGTNPRGEMMLFIPSGGGEIIIPTAGVISAFGLGKSTSSQGQNTFSTETVYIAVAIAVVSIGIAVVSFRKREKHGK